MLGEVHLTGRSAIKLRVEYIMSAVAELIVK